MFCKHKDIFGEVGKGVHSYRLYNIAVVDVLCTIFLAYLIKLMFPSYSFTLILMFLFFVGIVCHRLFCVRTTVDKILFN